MSKKGIERQTKTPSYFILGRNHRTPRQVDDHMITQTITNNTSLSRHTLNPSTAHQSPPHSAASEVRPMFQPPSELHKTLNPDHMIRHTPKKDTTIISQCLPSETPNFPTNFRQLIQFSQQLVPDKQCRHNTISRPRTVEPLFFLAELLPQILPNQYPMTIRCAAPQSQPKNSPAFTHPNN